MYTVYSGEMPIVHNEILLTDNSVFKFKFNLVLYQHWHSSATRLFNGLGVGLIKYNDLVTDFMWTNRLLASKMIQYLNAIKLDSRNWIKNLN